MKRYRMCEDTTTSCEEICAKSNDEASRKAKQWALDGSWLDDDEGKGGNVYVHWAVYELDDEGNVDEYGFSDGGIVVLEYPEPPCENTDFDIPKQSHHNWESKDDSVFSHGGGIIRYEYCTRCGMKKTVDTWSMDPYDGQQGYEETRYEPRDSPECPQSTFDEDDLNDL